MRFCDVFFQLGFIATALFAHRTREHGLRVCVLMLLQLLLLVEALVAECTLERSLVHGAMLD